MNNRHLIAATTSVYILGNAVFAASLAPAPAAAVLAACAGVLAIAWTSRGEDADGWLDAPVDRSLYLGCCAAALAAFVLGGEGHFFYAVYDWLIRDAVLADLVRGGPKTIYAQAGADYALRAPLGMYMLPALAGRAGGLQGAHIAMLAQNALLLASTLYVAGALATARRALVVALFLTFGGLDILPTVARAYFGRAPGEPFELPTVTTGWADLFAYRPLLQTVFWAPNHGLPGWWFGVLTLLAARRRLDLGALVASGAPLVLWSPLAIVTAPLFVLPLALREPARSLSSSRNWLAAGVCLLFAPIAAYLTRATDTINAGWGPATPNFWFWTVLTLLIEAPQAIFVAAHWRSTTRDDRPVLAVALVVLVAIPLVTFGPDNDLAFRGPLVALTALGFVFADVVSRLDPARQPVGRVAALLIVMLGLFGPAFEVARSFQRAPFAVSDCDLRQASIDYDKLAYGRDLSIAQQSHYVAPVERMPKWLIDYADAVRRDAAPMSCWPDHPLLRPAAR